jgi:hypothetical protein
MHLLCFMLHPHEMPFKQGESVTALLLSFVPDYVRWRSTPMRSNQPDEADNVKL